ncbi:MAG: ribosomal protein [Francisellaceae bacterium]|nr:ribosomal protein [Francisellaceae bacterium]
MRAGIHPEQKEINVKCNCGHVFKPYSTLCKDLHLDVCHNCHPFNTGKQRIIDTAGMVDKFKQKFGGFSVIKNTDKSA